MPLLHPCRGNQEPDEEPDHVTCRVSDTPAEATAAPDIISALLPEQNSGCSHLTSEACYAGRTAPQCGTAGLMNLGTRRGPEVGPD